MKFFKNLWQNVKLMWYGLFYGMRKVDNDVFSQFGASSDSADGVMIGQQMSTNRVSQAMLRGELTQEVKELRHRTYKVDREAKQYEFYSPTLAIKRDEKLDSKFVEYENSDNYELVTVQPNMALTEGILEGLQEIGSYGKPTDYLVNIERNNLSRFRLEEYTKRLVVRKRDDNVYVLDFYVSIYPNDKDFKSKGFVNEVRRIKDQGIRSDIIDIDKVSFVSSHAYRVNDMIKFVFNNVFFNKVVEFDGHYILRFKASLYRQNDLIDNFYCKEMDDKYKNKVKKEIPLDLFGGNTREVYVCECCGKEIVYDTQEIDDMVATRPREIDEEVSSDNTATEYLDVQIAEQTFGKRLCRECLKDYIEKRNK